MARAKLCKNCKRPRLSEISVFSGAEGFMPAPKRKRNATGKRADFWREPDRYDALQAVAGVALVAAFSLIVWIAAWPNL